MAESKLSPSEKVAVLIMAMGEEIAADIFKNMSMEEVRRIGSAMSRMGRIEQATIDLVMQEFVTLLHTKPSSVHTDGVGFAQRAIQLAFKGVDGERLANSAARGDIKMRVLEVADAPTLARILQSEVPQTIALVLAHAKPDKASALLKHWPEAARTEILLRMAKLNPVDPEMIAEIDQHLLQEVDRMGSLRQQKIGGSKQVAAILNRMDRDGIRLLDSLGERNPDLAEEIRLKMFTFDDLVQIDSRGIQELLKVVPQPTLLLALRGTNEAIQNLFFSNMSQRAGKLLREDLLAMAPQKASDVSKAQNDILGVVRTLEEEGKIVIERGAEKAVV